MISAPPNFANANTQLVKQPRHVFQVSGYSRMFTFGAPTTNQDRWIVEISSPSQKVDDLNGSSQFSDLSVGVIDKAALLTADVAANTLEGKVAILKTGFQGLANADFLTVATMRVDSIDSSHDGTAYTFNLKRDDRQLKAPIYQTGDNGKPTSNKNPKTLLGNPMDLLTSTLQTELGLAAGQINSNAINAYKNGLFAGMQMRFLLTTAPEGKHWIELELMKALGGYAFWNGAGQFTPFYFVPSQAVPVAMTLDQDKIIGVPLGKPARLLNTAKYRFDYGDSGQGGANSELGFTDSTSKTKYGMSASEGVHIIESQGVRSGYQGWAWARVLAHTLTQRYGYQNLTYDVKAFWPALVLEPGDYVYLTHPRVPDRSKGTIGVTNVLCEVLGRSWNFKDCTVDLKLLDVSWLALLVAYQIAADVTPAFPSASATQQQSYMFVASQATGNYSNGVAGNKVF